MSDFGEGRWVVAAKQHRCEYCYGTILKSEKHYQYKGMFDGEWQNWKMHCECWESYSADISDMADGFTPGEAPIPERVTSLPPPHTEKEGTAE